MINISHNIHKVISDIEKIAYKKNLELNNALNNHVEQKKEEMITTYFSGQHGDKGLNSNTGRAKNSWKIRRDLSNVEKKYLSIYSNVPYIETHETRTRRLDLRAWWKRQLGSFDTIIRRVFR